MFNIYKIKTMRDDRFFQRSITTSDDPRITRSGRLFRKFKIDELPQLFNVIRGDMSVVGPRPEVPEYAGSLSAEDYEILSVRPGITAPATIKYHNVERILAGKPDPEKYNRDVIWVDKISMNRQYAKEWSFGADILIILRTIKEIGSIATEVTQNATTVHRRSMSDPEGRRMAVDGRSLPDPDRRRMQWE